MPTTDLSNLLNVGTTFFARIDSDGCRFAIAYAAGLPAYVTTLAVVNGAFVVHEAPQQIGSGTNAYGINIASRASGGGSNTGYGIVFADHTPTPHRIVFATYDGHAAGGFATRPTGCGGLGITAGGRALLGHTATVTLTGTHGEPSGMLLGVPGPALALCTSCYIGVSLNGALVNLPNLATLNLAIPCMNQLARATLTVQGYAVGVGPCRGGLRLGDSLDITIQ